LEEVAVHDGHKVLMEVDLYCTDCWLSTMDFIPAPQASPNPLTKYYFILISFLYKYVLSIFLMRAIPMKAGNRTPIHLYSPQQLKSSKLNINLEQKNPETKFSKLFILNLEIFGHGVCNI
jgi:hypothetical protein